jgi:hypothetical protein
MGISGRVAGGMDQALEEVLERRFREAVRQQQERQDQERIAVQRETLEAASADRAADNDRQLKVLDLAELQRRDKNNDRSLDLMKQDKQAMDVDSAVESLPPHLKQIGGLFKIGAVGKLSPEDMESPDVRANRVATAREQAVQDQIRVRNATREPDRGRKSIQQVIGPDNQVQLVSVDLDTGASTPVQMPPGMAPNRPPKPITGAERQAVSYFNRMLEAERNARGVEGKLTGVDLGAAEAAPDFLENWLKSKEGQAYTQAQRTFTEGRLRKESGAAVPPGEYDNDRRTNFRIANDDPATIKQKRGSRVATMRGIGNSAGRALQEFYGNDATIDSLLSEFADQEGAAPMQKEIPGIPGAIAESTDGGKTWKRVK